MQVDPSRGYVGQVHIAFGGSTVPAEHRIDCFRELRAAPLIDAAAVDPEVLYLITAGLCAAEFDFVVAGLALSMSIDQISKGYFVGSPSVRKNSVGWKPILAEFGPAEYAVRVW